MLEFFQKMMDLSRTKQAKWSTSVEHEHGARIVTVTRKPETEIKRCEALISSSTGSKSPRQGARRTPDLTFRDNQSHKRREGIELLPCCICQGDCAALVNIPAAATPIMHSSPHRHQQSLPPMVLRPVEENQKWHGWTCQDPASRPWRGW